MSKPAVKVACESGIGAEGFTRCRAFSTHTKIKKRIKAGESEWFIFPDDDTKIVIKEFDNLRKLDLIIGNQTSTSLKINIHTEDKDELDDVVEHGHTRRIKASLKPVLIKIET